MRSAARERAAIVLIWLAALGAENMPVALLLTAAAGALLILPDCRRRSRRKSRVERKCKKGTGKGRSRIFG